MISPVTNRVPFSEIISPFDDYYDKNEDNKKNPHRPGNLIYSPNFVLILNDFVYSFQEISGIDRDSPYETLKDGGNFYPQFVHKFEKEENLTTLTLKRAMPIRRSQSKIKRISALLANITPTSIGLLRRQSLLFAAKQDPIYTLEHGPAEGFIQVFDRTFKNDVANFRFFSYGAYKWAVSELDATSGNIIYETIDLVCTNLTRILPSSVSSKAYSLWINQDNKSDSSNIQEINELEKNRIDELEAATKNKTDNLKNWKKENEQKQSQLEMERKEQEKRIQKWKDNLKNWKKENEEYLSELKAVQEEQLKEQQRRASEQENELKTKRKEDTEKLKKEREAREEQENQKQNQENSETSQESEQEAEKNAENNNNN